MLASVGAAPAEVALVPDDPGRRQPCVGRGRRGAWGEGDAVRGRRRRGTWEEEGC